MGCESVCDPSGEMRCWLESTLTYIYIEKEVVVVHRGRYNNNKCIIVCHLSCSSRRFDCLLAYWLHSTIYITLVGCDWCISILNVLARSCSLSGPLLYRFPVVFLDRGHLRFGNFNSAMPVDVIRVKSYVNSFLDPSDVPVRVSINKLYLVPKREMAGLVGVLRNGGGLGTGESYIPVVFFDSLMHRSSCFPDVDFSTFTRNPVDHAIFLS